MQLSAFRDLEKPGAAGDAAGDAALGDVVVVSGPGRRDLSGDT
jgi:hypothetical protein